MEIGHERFENSGSFLGQHPGRGYTRCRRSPSLIDSKTLPTFSNLFCPISTQPLLHIVQHIADCVHHSLVVGIPLLLFPSNSTILHLPLLLSFFMCTRVTGNHHHCSNIYIRKVKFSPLNQFTYGFFNTGSNKYNSPPHPFHKDH